MSTQPPSVVNQPSQPIVVPSQPVVEQSSSSGPIVHADVPVSVPTIPVQVPVSPINPELKFGPSKNNRVYIKSIFDKTHRASLNLKPHTDLLSAEHLAKTVRPQFNIPVNYPIYDQLQIGSCTACSGCMLFQMLMPRGTAYRPSRLFLYYTERANEHTLPSEGAYLSSTFSTMQHTGICSEVSWPYRTNYENVHPPSVNNPARRLYSTYTEALNYHITSYGTITPSGSDYATPMKTVINSGKPVVIGFAVYDSFESDVVTATGIVPMPDINTETLLGGHAVVVVGFDDSKSAFLCANSWGTSWGCRQPSGTTTTRGFFYLPYAYINNSSLLFDFYFANGVSFHLVPSHRPTLAPPSGGTQSSSSNGVVVTPQSSSGPVSQSSGEPVVTPPQSSSGPVSQSSHKPQRNKRNNRTNRTNLRRPQLRRVNGRLRLVWK